MRITLESYEIEAAINRYISFEFHKEMYIDRLVCKFRNVESKETGLACGIIDSMDFEVYEDSDKDNKVEE